MRMKAQTETKARAANPITVDLAEAELIEAVRRLPRRRRIKLLDKLESLREPQLRTVPADRLSRLAGLVSLGGDALADTEALYDGNNSR